jgi:limonene-1,2-epoxide hydrolase
MRSCTTPEEFLKDAASAQANYQIKNVFADGDDVCIIFDTIMSRPPITFPTCGLYHVKDGKINSVRLLFDASPFTSMMDGFNDE